MGISVIITGATGMVGEGVMHECLLSPEVDKILLLSRKSILREHPKLREIILENFFQAESIKNELSGYDACYFCLGVSAIGLSEEKYSSLTYDLSLNIAEMLYSVNPEMLFIYVSGAGTDSSEKGRLMWARVKGKTENAIIKLGFRDAYMFRPGFMLPTAGLKNSKSQYKYFNWMYPLLRRLLPNYTSTLKEVGIAMIKLSLKPNPKKILEVKDIVEIANTN